MEGTGAAVQGGQCGRPGCSAIISERRARRRARFCSAGCKATAKREAYKPKDGHDLPGQTVGAISELHVAADLMRRGYEVLQAMNPRGSCRLAVVSGGEIMRVSVRTASKTAGGRAIFFQGKGDVVALCFRDGSIEYRPPLAS